MSDNDWNKVLDKLGKSPTPLKTSTHLLAITLPDADWKQLTATGTPEYLVEADIAAWALGSYVDRHAATGELITASVANKDKVDKEDATLLIVLANILSKFNIEILNKIPMDALHYCRTVGLTLLARPEYENSEYLQKLVEICEEILLKRNEVITDAARQAVAEAFNI